MNDLAEIYVSLTTAKKAASEEASTPTGSGDPPATTLTTGAPGSVGPARWSELLQGRNLGRTLVLSGGVAVHAVYIYIVATILPQIVGDIGGVDYFAWSTTLFMVGSIVGSAAAAALECRSGPVKAYRWALSLFAVGSLLCALAPAMLIFVAGRFLQGLGGGLLPALAYTTIRQIFEARLHAKAISLVSGVWGISALVGPLAGGLFAASHAWRGAFWMAVPLCMVFAVVITRVLPVRSAWDVGRPTVPAVRLALLAMAALAISAGSIFGRTLEAIIGIVVAVALAAVLLRLEDRSSHRLFPREIGRPRQELGVISSTMLLLTLGSSAMAFLPYFLIEIFGVQALTAGYIVALEAIGWTATALLTSSVSPRHVGKLMLLSPLVMILAAGSLIASVYAGTVAGISIAMALTGVSMGLAWAHYGNRMIEIAQPQERPLAATFLSTSQLLGTAFGAALAGMVVNLAGLPHATTAGEMRHAAVILFSVFSAAPLLAAALCVLSKHFRFSAKEV
ncbi:MAG: transporter [Akkermansiaceae bacterium]|nr:transporter [Akkermansiaceae bacterium]